MIPKQRFSPFFWKLFFFFLTVVFVFLEVTWMPVVFGGTFPPSLSFTLCVLRALKKGDMATLATGAAAGVLLDIWNSGVKDHFFLYTVFTMLSIFFCRYFYRMPLYLSLALVFFLSLLYGGARLALDWKITSLSWMLQGVLPFSVQNTAIASLLFVIVGNKKESVLWVSNKP